MWASDNQFPADYNTQQHNGASAEHCSGNGTMLIVPHASGQSGLVTLKLATNLFEGGTGCHEWEAGFFLAEFVLSRPDIFKGMLCTSLHLSPARCTSLDKCTLQPCMSSL